MSRYTPAAIDLLVARCDRADQSKRLAALYDARAASTYAHKDFMKYTDTFDRD